jgi:ribosomal protein S3
MDRGYAVAVKKLGTIGVTVQIMRKGTKLPHEIAVFSEEELRIRDESETTEVEIVEEASK